MTNREQPAQSGSSKSSRRPEQGTPNTPFDLNHFREIIFQVKQDDAAVIENNKDIIEVNKSIIEYYEQLVKDASSKGIELKDQGDLSKKKLETNEILRRVNSTLSTGGADQLNKTESKKTDGVPVYNMDGWDYHYSVLTKERQDRPIDGIIFLPKMIRCLMLDGNFSSFFGQHYQVLSQRKTQPERGGMSSCFIEKCWK